MAPQFCGNLEFCLWELIVEECCLPDMNQIDFCGVLREAWIDFAEELKRVPLSHFNESVFRYIFVRRMLQKHPEVGCDTEWHRIDLLFVDSTGPSFVEFKFYVRNHVVDLQGKTRHAKGRAGKKNFKEFCDCINKLVSIDEQKWRKSEIGGFSRRYLVLTYADADDVYGPNSYGFWYDELELWKGLPDRVRITKLLTLEGVKCCKSTASLKCSAFEISNQTPGQEANSKYTPRGRQ